MSKILIVERDPVTTKALEFKLRSQGFVCESTSKGEDALSLMRSAHPDLVLLGISLQGKDGWYVLEEKSEDPDIQHIPVIVMTNIGGERESERAKKLGAVDYIIKAEYTIHRIVELVQKSVH